MHTTEWHTTEWHTIECNKRSVPPQLTLYGLPYDAKRQCFGRNIKKSQSNSRLPDDLLKTARTLKMLDVIDNATNPNELCNLPLNAEKHLRQLSIRLNDAANRLSQLVATSAISNPSALSPPPSPLDQQEKCGYKATDQGVVAGIGVVAQCQFRAGDSVAHYTGPIVFRTMNPNGRYHVFSVSTIGSAPQVRFHERDTYIAWSGNYLLHSGKSGIEIGRDGDGDMRFLNHSKKANVQIVSTGADRMNIYECHEQLLLTVVALKDINPGDELVFDYDKSKPDSAIDFSLRMVEQPGTDKASKIHTSIARICQESDPLLRSLRASPERCMNQQVKIPVSVDKVIGQIMTLCEEIQVENSFPAQIDELMSRLSTDQKKLLRLIFADDEPAPGRIESLANSMLKNNNPNDSDRLTLKGAHDLKKYLTESFFNSKQTWITVEELKQRLHDKQQLSALRNRRKR